MVILYRLHDCQIYRRVLKSQCSFIPSFYFCIITQLSIFSNGVNSYLLKEVVLSIADLPALRTLTFAVILHRSGHLKASMNPVTPRA